MFAFLVSLMVLVTIAYAAASLTASLDTYGWRRGLTLPPSRVEVPCSRPLYGDMTVNPFAAAKLMLAIEARQRRGRVVPIRAQRRALAHAGWPMEAYG